MNKFYAVQKTVDGRIVYFNFYMKMWGGTKLDSISYLSFDLEQVSEIVKLFQHQNSKMIIFEGVVVK